MTYHFGKSQTGHGPIKVTETENMQRAQVDRIPDAHVGLYSQNGSDAYTDSKALRRSVDLTIHCYAYQKLAVLNQLHFTLHIRLLSPTNDDGINFFKL